MRGSDDARKHVAAVTRAQRLIALCLLAAGCVNAAGEALTPAERFIIDDWLICIECTNAVDSLRAVGARKPKLVIDALNSALVQGPPPPSIFAAESALALSFLRDSGFRARTGQGTIPLRAVYVSEGRDRYSSGYRSRGALGLGYIGTPGAKLSLDSAATLGLPQSVKNAIQFARDSLP